MYHITAAVIWRESDTSKKSQRIMMRYLSNFFGTRLVVREYCIDKFGQNHIIPQYDLFLSDEKQIHFWTKPIRKILTISLESLYYQECSNESESNAISIIDIVVGGDRGQGKFRLVYKIILREMNVKTLIRM